MPLLFSALLSIVLCAFAVRPASAQTFESLGTRAQGMGGAFVAVADDASAVYWNPAGLGTGAAADIQLEGGHQGTVFAGLAIPSFGLSYWRSATVLVSGGRQEEGWGEVRLQRLETNNFGMTLLQTVVNGVLVGTTVRLVRGEVGATGARTSVDIDAGMMASIGSFRVGLTGRNLRQPEFQGDRSEPVSLQRQVRMGVALVPRSRPAGLHGPFTVAVDLDVTKVDSHRPSTGSATNDPGRAERVERRHLAMGGEYWWASGRVGARGGLRVNTLGDRDPVGAAGVSVGLPRSMFIEGQMTKGQEDSADGWGVTVRMTF